MRYILTALLIATSVDAQPRTPEAFLGFRVGSDYTLANWSQIVDYFTELAGVSERVHLETLGESTNGRPFVMAVISSEENLSRLDAIKEDQRRLADPRLVTSEETDVPNGKISTTSPIGRGLMGKQVGDVAEVRTPAGRREFEILELATIHDQSENR